MRWGDGKRGFRNLGGWMDGWDGELVFDPTHTQNKGTHHDAEAALGAGDGAVDAGEHDGVALDCHAPRHDDLLSTFNILMLGFHVHLRWLSAGLLSFCPWRSLTSSTVKAPRSPSKPSDSSPRSSEMLGRMTMEHVRFCVCHRNPSVCVEHGHRRRRGRVRIESNRIDRGVSQNARYQPQTPKLS